MFDKPTKCWKLEAYHPIEPIIFYTILNSDFCYIWLNPPI